MGCMEVAPATAVYRPRAPKSSPLYQCVLKRHDELEVNDAIHRQVERLHQAVLKFLVEDEAITEDFVRKLMAWEHSGLLSVVQKMRGLTMNI